MTGKTGMVREWLQKIGVGLLIIYMLNVVVVLMHCMMVEIDQSIKIICNTRTSNYLITIILKIKHSIHLIFIIFKISSRSQYTCLSF